jgi:hypothetical protein
MHANDLLALPVKWGDVENFSYRTCLSWLWIFNLLGAHSIYWKNRKIIEKMINTIVSWQVM